MRGGEGRGGEDSFGLTLAISPLTSYIFHIGEHFFLTLNGSTLSLKIIDKDSENVGWKVSPR